MSRRSVALGYGLSILISALVAEGALQLAAKLSRTADCFTHECPRFEMDDQGFVLKGNSLWPDHDAFGFRNPHALAQADIVAIGDSQTYGVGVSTGQAWPAVLATQLGKSEYNMALPGLGPLEEHRLLDKALALHPKLIVLGWSSNALAADFAFAMKKKRLKEFVSAETIAAIDSAQRVGDLGDKPEVRVYARTAEAGAAPPPQDGDRGVIRRTKLFFGQHSRVYGFARAIRDRMAHQNTPAPAQIQGFADAVAAINDTTKPYPARPFVSVFSDSAWKTIFSAPFRLVWYDRSDVRIAAGLTIDTLEMREIRNRCTAAGARLIVVYMPTKEFVFQDRVHDPAARKGYAELMAAESSVKRDMEAFFKANAIDFVDPVPTLRAAPTQPYFENSDGHPNRLGQELIAKSVLDYLRAHDVKTESK